jgi:CheY-like chemotaxis protein
MIELKKILLVEDSRNDAELALTALARTNLATDVALVRDGAQALDYLHRKGQYAGLPPGNPVVVLLDLKLPKIDGLEVLRRMKSDEKLRSIPVVILTSSREDRELATCYLLGVNAYVVKPINFNDYLERVRELGTFWAQVNEPPPGSVRV